MRRNSALSTIDVDALLDTEAAGDRRQCDRDQRSVELQQRCRGGAGSRAASTPHAKRAAGAGRSGYAARRAGSGRRPRRRRRSACRLLIANSRCAGPFRPRDAERRVRARYALSASSIRKLLVLGRRESGNHRRQRRQPPAAGRSRRIDGEAGRLGQRVAAGVADRRAVDRKRLRRA